MATTTTAAAAAAASKNKPRTYSLIPRREIEALISEGRNIIIVDQHVLKVDGWMKYHPGGDKAIKHMVGRDATDEVNGYVFFPALFCGTSSIMNGAKYG